MSSPLHAQLKEPCTKTMMAEPSTRTTVPGLCTKTMTAALPSLRNEAHKAFRREVGVRGMLQRRAPQFITATRTPQGALHQYQVRAS